MINRFIFPLFLLLLSSVHPLQAQYEKKEPETTNILFIFDASYSMNGFWEDNKKITIARKTLINIIDSLENIENLRMALRVYGHQSPVPPQDCDDTKLEVHFADNNGSAIRQKLRFISPKGTTPLTNSLLKSKNDFPKNCTNCRNIIILITDGVEECKGDPCEASKELQKKGISLKPFIIGIGIDENFRKTFDCIGNYYNANNKDQFESVMNIVINQVLNSTTAQVNLLDKNGKPTETNVNMTFFDSYSGQIRHNYIHTINYRGNPDTIVLDPLVTYRMRVNTLPPVFVDDIKVESGKHSIISADCPQGQLLVKKTGNKNYNDLLFNVKEAGKSETLNFQEVGNSEKYIVGKYDIEIPVLPPIKLENVSIKQSHTTTIEIPRPGILNLLLPSQGYGSIYKLKNNDMEWVCNIDTKTKNEKFVLLPGQYKVVFRPQNAKNTLYSISRIFEIESGSAISIRFN